MVERRLRTHLLFRQARGVRRCVRIKSWTIESHAGPPTGANHFVRVGCASDGICARAFGSAPSVESSHSQVETSPKKMHGTTLAQEPRTELFENRITGSDDAPEAMRRVRIIGTVEIVVSKRNGVGNFHRLSVDGDVNTERTQG